MSSPANQLTAFDIFIEKFCQDEAAKFGIIHQPESEFLQNLALRRWNKLTQSEKNYYEELTKSHSALSSRISTNSELSPVVVTNKTLITNSSPSISRQISKRHQMTDNCQLNSAISKSSVNSAEMELLANRIGHDYVQFSYLIVSSNVFARENKFSIPAELGIAKFSFYHGIMSTFHSFFPPKDIEKFGRTELARCNAYHKIPNENFDFPHLPLIIRKVHKFIHVVKEDTTKVAYLFAENDEIEQVREVFVYFENQSKTLNLNIEWNVHCLSLSSLFTFLKAKSPSKAIKWRASDAFVVFKGNDFANSELCYFHKKCQCPNCAISKSYIYCYILSDNFCSIFGIQTLPGVHKPMGPVYY